MSSSYTVDTPAGPLSGRISGPQTSARGLVVALHGGTYDSAYYDTGSGSLLDAGAALGLCVVALDRPGYGASAGIDPKWFTFAAQADLLTAAMSSLSSEIAPALGTVLVGHSIGGMIALGVAAAGGVELRGVEVSGIGARWRPGMLEMWSSFLSDQPSIEVPAPPHGQVMFGPAGTFTEERLAANAALIRPMPMPELADVVRWTDVFPATAADVRVPVSVSFPEHDNIWQTDPEARAAAAQLFTGSPSVAVGLVGAAGHSTELHLRGRGYTLRQLAFVEDCLVTPTR